MMQCSRRCLREREVVQRMAKNERRKRSEEVQEGKQRMQNGCSDS